MTSAVLVAAGRGTRMGHDVDKLFLQVAGLPVVAHTWRRFDLAACIDEIILVVRDEMRSAFEELAEEFKWRKPFRFAAGGKQRQNSVWNGLQAVSPRCDIVAIHDGARPCTSVQLIAATIQAARAHGAAVAAQRVTDTIKESGDGQTISRHLDRARLWSVQTPQTFRIDVIRRALLTALERGVQVTDDTAACELIGQPVTLIESADPNPKVTLPGDLALIETLLKRP